MRQGLGYKYQHQALRLADFVSFMEKRRNGTGRPPEEIANAVLWLCSDAASYSLASPSRWTAVSSCAEGDEENRARSNSMRWGKRFREGEKRPARQRKAG
jgi:hypothetical protein